MEHMDLFNAKSPKGQPQIFPLFELDKDGEIKLDLDNDNEFNPENLSFKAVNKGLGFHHKENLKSANSLNLNKRPRTSLKEANQTPAVILGKNKPIQNNFEAVTLNQNELAILNGPIQSALKVEENKAPQTTSLQTKSAEANFIKKSLAWLIDLFCISFCLATTLALFSYLSNIHWSKLATLLPPMEIALFLGTLFVIYYLLYFTVLDLHQSPGKSLIGLHLERLDGRRIKVKQTFTRAFVGLLSFMLLGLPLTMDFQGKLSETKLVH